MGCAGHTGPIHESNLQDVKDLLLIFWCLILHHTFRDLVESMPQKVIADLVAQGGSVQYFSRF